MDLNMPGISGVEATRQIAMIAPLTRVLVLTISDQDARRDGRDPRRRVRLPAEGRVDRRADRAASGAAASGESLVSPAIAREGAAARARDDASRRDEAETIRAELSDRELQVLKLIANGKDNAHDRRASCTSARRRSRTTSRTS